MGREGETETEIRLAAAARTAVEQNVSGAEECFGLGSGIRNPFHVSCGCQSISLDGLTILRGKSL